MYTSNQYIYARERRRFGRQCLFSDQTKPMASVHPSSNLRLYYILRNPVDRSTQLSDQKAFSVMETENVTYGHHGMYHYEGGWPKDVNIHDEESTLRHRKKIEREDIWGIQVNELIRNAVKAADQNTAINIYQDFFEELPPDSGTDIRSYFEARPENIFHDPVNPHRIVQIVDWAPNDLNKFMAQHASRESGSETEKKKKKEDGQEVLSDYSFFIWDLENPLKPFTVLDCHEIVMRALYCPRDDNFIGGGDSTGKSMVWDSRNGGMPIQICPLEAAHRESVSAICWVHSKTNTEFYTGSWDGSVKYWDGRDLKEPIQEILLDPEPTDDQSRERAHGVTFLEFEYTIPVRYIIASDLGHIFIGNRKGMTPTETLLSNYRIFSGPIRTIERNPFFVKNFLIVADWCAKVWAEECKGSPTTLLFKKKNELMCGTWSTTRCSLFLTGDVNGELDFWDLLLDQRHPIFTLNLKTEIRSVKFRPDGEQILVGLSNGDCHVLELDETMKWSGPRDKALIAALFERELLRCKLLDGRVEEIKLKRKTSVWEAEQRVLAEEEQEIIQNLDLNDSAQFLQLVETDIQFKEAIRLFNDITLKVEKKRQERDYVMERTEFEYDDYESASPEEIPEPTPAPPTIPTTAASLSVETGKSLTQKKGKKKK